MEASDDGKPGSGGEDDGPELPTLEAASQEDLDLVIAALGPLAMYGGFLRAALAGVRAERERGGP